MSSFCKWLSKAEAAGKRVYRKRLEPQQRKSQAGQGTTEGSRSCVLLLPKPTGSPLTTDPQCPHYFSVMLTILTASFFII